MWDARLDGADLDTLVRDMITEAHFMNMDSRLMQERLKQVPEYARRFEEVYGQGNDPYGGKVYGAVAEFLREIRTENAPFDSYLRGDEAALTKQRRRGMELFAGKAGCAACHKGAMLSDGALHVTGVPENAEIEGSADRQISILRHFATMGVPNYMNRRVDVGHYVVSKDDRDLGAFKTPSSAA